MVSFQCFHFVIFSKYPLKITDCNFSGSGPVGGSVLFFFFKFAFRREMDGMSCSAEVRKACGRGGAPAPVSASRGVRSRKAPPAWSVGVRGSALLRAALCL